MSEGSLTYDEYLRFFNKKLIFSSSFKTKQIQPSSIDLTISKDCYKIKSSFLAPNTKVKQKFKKFVSKKWICFKKKFNLFN